MVMTRDNQFLYFTFEDSTMKRYFVETKTEDTDYKCTNPNFSKSLIIYDANTYYL